MEALYLNSCDYKRNCVTTITVSERVKGDLAKWKPADVSWTSFLRVMQESVDVDVLQTKMQALLEAEEQLAVERAADRYRKVRGDRKAGVKARDLLGELS